MGMGMFWDTGAETYSLESGRSRPGPDSPAEPAVVVNDNYISAWAKGFVHAISWPRGATEILPFPWKTNLLLNI